MLTAEQLARLLSYREAAASVALDGQTQHGPQSDYLCCLDHARRMIAELEAEVERLRARVAILADALRRLEWYGSDGETYWCPACGEYDHEGHLEDCSLAAALKEASDGE